MNRTGRPHEIEPTTLDLSVVLRARTEIGESPVRTNARKSSISSTSPGRRSTPTVRPTVANACSGCRIW